MQRYLRNQIAGILGMVIERIGLLEKAKNRITPGYILPLCLHNPETEVFRKLIIWLRENDYSFISTSELFNILRGINELDKRAVWLTFDDGWQDNLYNVIPSLIAYDIPATFFITTSPVESEEGVFWWSFMKANESRLPIAYQELWSIPESHRREIVTRVETGKHNKLSRQAMTLSEVKRIAELPQVTIGCHTLSHGLTSNCTALELEEEIGNAGKKISGWIGREVKYFAYPKGACDGRETDVLMRHGYVLAATTEMIPINTHSLEGFNLFRVPRIAIPDSGYFQEIICHTLGVWQPLMQRLKGVKAVILSVFNRG
jgi:poly-beta-1,6-N-acetyl-D-glucosamine N-deacetylase